VGYVGGVERRDDAHDAGLLGLFVVGLVLGIRWLVSAKRDAGLDAALDILRQRYARGESDREEFLARKRDL
jgi:uncharacterized membrane protein